MIPTLVDFWQMGAAAGDREFRAKFQFEVNYYDPEWRVIWVRQNGIGAYLGAGQRRLPFRAGDVVEFDGWLRPGRQEVLWERSDLRIVGTATNEVVVLPGDSVPSPPFNFQVVSVEGWVDDQVDVDAAHTRLTVLTPAWTASLIVHLSPLGAVPQWRGARIRFRGVLSIKRDGPDTTMRYEIWICEPADIEVIGWIRDDPAFHTRESAIDDLFGAPTNQLRRVKGTVRGQEPGISLTVRDGTGQVRILTSQTSLLQVGTPVEAVGIPRTLGAEVILTQGRYLPAVGAGAVSPALPLREMMVRRRLTEQVRELNAEEAAMKHPVGLRGVVTWSDAAERRFYLQDASGGVIVELAPDYDRSVPASGIGVLVEGSTRPGSYVSHVLCTKWSGDQNRSLPAARKLILEEALTGAAHGAWSEIQAYVRDHRAGQGREQLELVTAAGEFEADVPSGEAPVAWKGAVVRMRGVCEAITDGRRLTGIRFRVPSREQIEILQPTPVDAFDAELQSLTRFLQYRAQQAIAQRVKISGTVLIQRPGRWLSISDGERSIEVLTRQDDPLDPGDVVEVVGLPGWRAGRPVFREGNYRRTGARRHIEPVDFYADLEGAEDRVGRLVRTEGVVVDASTSASALRLSLQDGRMLFDAVWDGKEGARHEAFPRGSRVEVVGVCRQVRDEYGLPDRFEIQMRTEQDIRVLQQPPWWTLTKLMGVAGFSLVGGIGVMAWGLTLSRKNQLLRDAEGRLRRMNDQLEERVRERTQDLELEVRDRQRSEDALRVSNQRFEVVTRATSDVIWDWDVLTDAIWWNANFSSVFGHSPESPRGRASSWEACLHPEDADAARRSLGESLQSGSAAWSAEYRFRRSDGTYAFVYDRAYVLRDDAGRPVRLIGAMQDITARRHAEREVELIHRKLVRASRHAGMAEVATGVLHNVGNVLNSVNVSTQVLCDRVRQSSAANLPRLSALIDEHQADLGAFLATDPRGRAVPSYLRQLTAEMERDREWVLRELELVGRNVDHIKEIVAMQQDYARVAGVSETLALAEVAEDAIRMNEDSLIRHQVRIERSYDPATPMVNVDRHRVLQILVNLIRNAKFACDESGREDRLIEIRIAHAGNRARIEVADNGIGIPSENLVRIFNHGFTTRKEGHGYGLHSAALAAREMGGALQAHSEGSGRGALFVLELPAEGATAPAAAAA